MKLIHCADLHLDSPMESNLGAARARERRAEVRAGFGRLVRYAKEENVDAILIAGDMFDGERVSAGTLQYVLGVIRSAPSVRFYYLAGNHDKGAGAFATGEAPENLFLFSDTWTSYTLCEGVVLTGSERPDEDALTVDPENVNILLLHGQERVGRGAAAEDVIRLGKLKRRGIDYVALGHIHEYRETKLDTRGIACYAGTLEGRGFDECGEKGFVLLSVEGGVLSHTFVPFASRTLHTVTVPMDACTNAYDVEEAVERAVANIDSKDLVKVLLSGKRLPDLFFDTRDLAARLCERFYFAKVRDESTLFIRPEDFENDISLRGEFVRRVLASKLSESEKARVIACGLRALAGEETGL